MADRPARRDRGRRGAGRRRRDGRRLHRRVRGCGRPPATRTARPRAARARRLASRAFDAEIARGEAVVRNVIPALALAAPRRRWVPCRRRPRLLDAGPRGARRRRRRGGRRRSASTSSAPTTAAPPPCRCPPRRRRAGPGAPAASSTRARTRRSSRRRRARRCAVCLTERDRATLEDHGARARLPCPLSSSRPRVRRHLPPPVPHPPRPVRTPSPIRPAAPGYQPALALNALV